MKCQVNAVTELNGFLIKLVVLRGKLKLIVTRGSKVVDVDEFDYNSPSDLSAAFAKYSNAITHAVTADAELYESQA